MSGGHGKLFESMKEATGIDHCRYRKSGYL